MMEICGLARAIMSRKSCAMKVLPPPLFAMMSMFASPMLASKSEKGTSCR